MPISVTCPTCDARLKAPDGSAGRTLRCPRCTGSVVVPIATGPPAPLAFEQSTASTAPAEDDYPFEDEPATGEGDSADGPSPRRHRRSTAKRKPVPGYNPFDEEPVEESPTGPAKKRRYRKDADYNPFSDGPQDEVPDPTGDGFDFGIEAPPPAPTGEFDFGPPDPRGEDPDRRRRR